MRISVLFICYSFSYLKKLVDTILFMFMIVHTFQRTKLNSLVFDFFPCLRIFSDK